MTLIETRDWRLEIYATPKAMHHNSLTDYYFQIDNPDVIPSEI
jgi:hypothetical protein